MYNLIKNLSLLLVGVLAALALGEAGVKIMEAMRRNKEISCATLCKYSVIQLDALNYNETASPRSKPPGSFRILSFGDSFAYSIVRAPHHYHGLAANLASELSKRPVRIVNLGEPAVSFYQYMKAYEVWGKLFEHDAVIFNVYLGNDLLDVAYGYLPDDAPIHRLFLHLDRDLATGKTRSVALPRKFPLRVFDYFYMAYLHYSGAIESVPTAGTTGPYNFAVAKLKENVWLDNLNAQLDNFDASKIDKLRDGYVAAIQFARFVARLKDRGKRVVVLLSPNQSQVNDNVLHGVVTTFNRDPSRIDLDLSAYLIQRIFHDSAKDIPLLYLRPVLKCAEQTGVSTYYETDTHWSAEGNQSVGRHLGRWLAINWFGAASDDSSNALPCSNAVYEGSQSIRGTPEREFIYASRIKPLVASAPVSGRMQ